MLQSPVNKEVFRWIYYFSVFLFFFHAGFSTIMYHLSAFRGQEPHWVNRIAHFACYGKGGNFYWRITLKMTAESTCVLVWASKQLNTTQPPTHSPLTVWWGRELEKKWVELIGWNKHYWLRQKRKEEITGIIIIYLSLYMHIYTEQVMQRPIAHHSLVDAQTVPRHW